MKKTLYIAPAIEILQVEAAKPICYSVDNTGKDGSDGEWYYAEEKDPDPNSGEVGSKGFTGGWDDEW